MRSLRSYRNPLILLVLVGLVAASAHAATSLRQEVKTIDWTSRNMQALHRLIPNHKTATAFVREFYSNSALVPNVGEYCFANLGREEGGVSFLATLDWSGRAFYTTILIVRKQHGRLATESINTGGASVSDLRGRIVDLKYNGKKEILVPRLLGPYKGAQPVPVISDVYQWNGSHFEEADSAFFDYYSGTVLPQLQSRLKKLKEGQTITSPKSKAKLKKVIEKEIAAVKKIIQK